MKKLCFLWLIAVAFLPAQEIEEKLSVFLREVRVHVIDGDGNSVKGLKMEDFLVKEGFRQQPLSYFEEVDLISTEPRTSSSENLTNTISHQQDPRYLVLVIDSSNMAKRDFKRFITAGLEFVEHSVRPNDVVKIVQIDEGMEHLTPFTSDVAQLKQGLKTAKYKGRFYKDLLLLERDIVDNVAEHLEQQLEIYSQKVQFSIRQKEILKQNYYRTFFLNMQALTRSMTAMSGSKSIFLLTGGGFVEYNGELASTELLAKKLGSVMNSANITIYSLLSKSAQTAGSVALSMSKRPIEHPQDPSFSVNNLKLISKYPPNEDAGGLPSSNTVFENDVQVETGPSEAAETTGGFYRATLWAKDIGENLNFLNERASRYYRLGYSTDGSVTSGTLTVTMSDNLRSKGYKLVYGKRFDVPKPYLEQDAETRAMEFESLLIYSRNFRDDFDASWGFEVFRGEKQGYRIPVFAKIPKLDKKSEKGLEVGFAAVYKDFNLMDITRSELTKVPTDQDLLLYDVLVTERVPAAVRFYVRNTDDGALSFGEIAIEPEGQLGDMDKLSPVVLSTVDQAQMILLNHYRKAEGKEATRIQEDPFFMGESSFKPGLDSNFDNPQTLGFFFHLYDAPEGPSAHDLNLTVTQDGQNVALAGTLNKIHSPTTATHQYFGQLKTESLEPGTYQLTVEITQKTTGTTHKRTKEFTVDRRDL